ncbi:MAG: DUF2141 domain-containing protein [Cyclobacteriaceae bacterium]|nr:DUF2141 domain-containing protein [Cyclobacteriaceae bacterium]MCH8517473.1 DUF2141 domain-containing protein [Cyclobacteriaceae bacterium]
MRLFFSSLFVCFIFFHQLSFGQTRLIIEDIKNNEGKILISVFESKKGFPDDPDESTQNFVINAKKGKISLELEKIKSDEFAVAVVHDENDNGEMDTNAFGMPQEGYGMSNLEKKLRTKPKYKNYAVASSQPEVKVKILYP